MWAQYGPIENLHSTRRAFVIKVDGETLSSFLHRGPENCDWHQAQYGDFDLPQVKITVLHFHSKYSDSNPCAYDVGIVDCNRKGDSFPILQCLRRTVVYFFFTSWLFNDLDLMMLKFHSHVPCASVKKRHAVMDSSSCPCLFQGLAGLYQ